MSLTHYITYSSYNYYIYCSYYTFLYYCPFFVRKMRASGGGAAARALIDTEFDDDPAPTATASAGQDDASPARYNSKGLRINVNCVVSMRELDLASLVPSKTRYIDAKR